MRLLKKLTVAMIAVFMMFGIMINAFAQEQVVGTGNGSVTITNAKPGEDYSLYKLFDASISNGGANIVYKTEKPDLNAGGINGGQWFTVNAFNEVEALPAFNTDVLKSDDFKTWAKAYGTQVGTTVKAADDLIEFKQVPYGYYFVESTLGTVITVSSAKPDASIIDKNDKPNWKDDKKISLADGTLKDVNEVGLNEPFNFRISIDASNYDGTDKVYRYLVKDVFPAGATIDPSTLTVRVTSPIAPNPVTTIDKIANQPVTGYTLHYYSDEDLTVETADATAARGFKIYVPWTEDDTKAGANRFVNGSELVVFYTLKFDPAKADQVDYTDANINTAWFDYFKGSEDYGNNDPDHHVPSKQTETFTTQIELNKFFMDNGVAKPLEGAEFTLTGQGNKAVYISGTRFVKDPAGTYWLLKDGTYTTTDPSTPGISQNIYASTTDRYKKEAFTESKGTGLTDVNVKAFTGADGKITFKGLSAGTYTITESVVPNGYNRAKDVTFELSFDEATKTWSVNNTSNSGVVYDNGTFKVDIENKTGTVLPETGGIGTTLFYTVGGMLVIGAGVLLVVRKRMALNH